MEFERECCIDERWNECRGGQTSLNFVGRLVQTSQIDASEDARKATESESERSTLQTGSTCHPSKCPEFR